MQATRVTQDDAVVECQPDREFHGEGSHAAVWEPLLEAMRGRKRMLASFLDHGTPVGLEEDVLWVSFENNYYEGMVGRRENLEIIQDELGWDLPVIRDQALNERHYGDLQGLDKDETRARHGDEQVHIWRRSFDVPPPNSKKITLCSATCDPLLKTTGSSLTVLIGCRIVVPPPD